MLSFWDRKQTKTYRAYSMNTGLVLFRLRLSFTVFSNYRSTIKYNKYYDTKDYSLLLVKQ